MCKKAKRFVAVLNVLFLSVYIQACLHGTQQVLMWASQRVCNFHR